MRKTPLKMRPLQDCIEAFHKSPLYESKVHVKVQQNKLRKIGRNKMVFKEPSLPYLKPIKNKQNQHPNSYHQVKKPPQQRGNTKNFSFAKQKMVDMEQKLARMIESQRDVDQHINQNIKEIIFKKQYFIRDKKLLPERNCMSAANKKQIKKDPSLPHGIREMRKVMHLRKSKQAKQQQEQKQMPVFKQAQKIAEQARPFTSPKASRHPIRSASLEDFLNEWRCNRCE